MGNVSKVLLSQNNPDLPPKGNQTANERKELQQTSP